MRKVTETSSYCELGPLAPHEGGWQDGPVGDSAWSAPGRGRALTPERCPLASTRMLCTRVPAVHTCACTYAHTTHAYNSNKTTQLTSHFLQIRVLLHRQWLLCPGPEWLKSTQRPGLFSHQTQGFSNPTPVSCHQEGLCFILIFCLVVTHYTS